MASDSDENDWFGKTVCLTNNNAVVSSPNNANTGAVYVFNLEGDEWKENQKISPMNQETVIQFATSLSLSENYIVVGSSKNYNNEKNTGSVYIYQKENEYWKESAKIIASDCEDKDQFGSSVSD